MSLALYRKYRPATFAEVVGQEHVTGPLSQALTNGRLSHAYLFSGPRGCGKTSSARILARSLNCAQGPTPTPCGVCESCVALAPGGPGSLDVIEIDAASHNGVDDARDLRERAAFSPASSRFKVYVIDEAHMVTKSAFNALLKLVEEPPPFVKFVFATTEPEEVLQTIRSRTHHYPFRLLPPGVLRELLEDICAKEGVAVEPAVLPLVVAAGAGSARDALSVLDQLLAGAGERGVTYADALPLLGVTDAALLDDTIDALAAGDAAAVFETVDRVVEAGHDPRRFAADLLQRLRDLIIIGAVPEAAAKGLIAAPEDQLATMTGQAGRLGPAALSRMADVVHGSLDTMRGTTSPRLLLELVCARMLLPAATGDAAAMLQRLERLERRLDIATPAPAAAEPATAAGSAVRRSPAAAPDRTTSRPPTERRAAARPERQVAAPPDANVSASSADSVPVGSADSAAQDSEHTAPGRSGDGAAEPGGIDTAAVRRAWPNILAAVGKQRRVVAAYLLDANVTAIQGSTLVLGFPHPFHAKALSEPPAIDYFTDALTEVLGVRWTVRCEVTDGSQLPLRGEPAGPTTPQPVASIPGFAAGDAPTDEESADAADRSTQTTEEQAISLLAQNLGARKIGEVENG